MKQSRSEPGKHGQTARRVGAQLRRLRRSYGLAQAELAEKLDVSFQQLQKYEQGKNELTAQRLYHVACIFRVPVAFLFGEDEYGGCSHPYETDLDEILDLTQSTESWRLAEGFNAIRDVETQRALIQLAWRLASAASADGD